MSTSFGITNGGGGWGACARIVSVDGKPLQSISERRTGQSIHQKDKLKGSKKKPPKALSEEPSGP